MNKDLNNEFQYQITMSIIRQLKKSGTFSDSEYRQINALMLRKYRPVVATLLAGNRTEEQL